MLASVLERSNEYFHLQITKIHPVDIFSRWRGDPSFRFLLFCRCDLLRFFRLLFFDVHLNKFTQQALLKDIVLGRQSAVTSVSS